MRSLLVACLAVASLVSVAGEQWAQAAETEAKGRVRLLHAWSLSRNQAVRAETLFRAWASAVERHVPALFPHAQSPLLALGRLSRRYCDRAGAITALRRLFALPASEDPWWDYHASPVRDASVVLQALHTWALREATR